MKIDSWDIRQADARQWNVTFGFHELKNDSEWVAGSLVPVMQRNRIGFKQLSVRVMIKSDEGRQAMFARGSMILSHLVDLVDLELDGFRHRFRAVLTGSKYEEVAMHHFHALTLEFDCYEYGDEIIRHSSGRSAFIVDNSGNLDTPVRIEITVPAACGEITLAGICHDTDSGEELDITVKNLTPGKTVVIDGETGLVTEGGQQKAGDAEFWEIPTLRPGENEVRISGGAAEVRLAFCPRYM